MKIIFLGTPEFGAINLRRMVEAGYKPELVITAPDRPAGRGQKMKESTVSKVAAELNLRVAKPDKLSDLTDEIKEISPSLMVVAAYGQYIPGKIIEISQFGILNVHPSLLPKYRGSSPIQYAILNGDKRSGTTIILINKEMDKGDILAQEEIELSKDETYLSLFEKLTPIGADLLVQTIPRWLKGEITPVKQKEIDASYSKLLTRQDGKIDWSSDAASIDRQVRAFNPWPGAFTYFNQKRRRLMKILKGEVLEQTDCGPFGPIGKIYMAPNERLAIQTGKDFFVVEEFQLDGEKPIKTSEYLSKKIDLIGIIVE